MDLELPVGYHLSQEHCPECGTEMVEVDRVEGLPIYCCPHTFHPGLLGRCRDVVASHVKYKFPLTRDL